MAIDNNARRKCRGRWNDDTNSAISGVRFTDGLADELNANEIDETIKRRDTASADGLRPAKCGTPAPK